MRSAIAAISSCGVVMRRLARRSRSRSRARSWAFRWSRPWRGGPAAHPPQPGGGGGGGLGGVGAPQPFEVAGAVLGLPVEQAVAGGLGRQPREAGREEGGERPA